MDSAKSMKKEIEKYKCQFCEKEYSKSKWIKNRDKCPGCGRMYDPILAQEMDEF